MKDRTATTYEAVVKTLMAADLQGAAVNSFEAYHLKKYLGKSGHNHEIDVSFEFALGSLKFVILIECKNYSRKVGVEEVAEFVYRLRDIGAQKGVMVTTVGFQAGAVAVARKEGIGLLTVAHGKVMVALSPPRDKTPLWFTGFHFAFDQESQSVYMYGTRLFCAPHDIPMVRELSSLDEEFLAIDKYDESLAFLEVEEFDRPEWRIPWRDESGFEHWSRGLRSFKSGNRIV